jgi:AFG3 family protein
MAGGLVTVYGMSDKMGLVSYNSGDEQSVKPYSEGTNEDIDEEIRRIVKECYARTKELLEGKRELMKK